MECTDSDLSSSMTLAKFCKESSSSREILANVEVLVSSDLKVDELPVIELSPFMSIPLDVSLKDDNSCIALMSSIAFEAISHEEVSIRMYGGSGDGFLFNCCVSINEILPSY